MARARTCRECAQRGWLLGRLSARLDFRSRDESRLLELLALDDERLIDAIAGRRRDELRRDWRQRTSASPGAQESASREPGTEEPTLVGPPRTGAPAVETVCRHGSDYPRGLQGWAGAPRMLYVLGGGAWRLGELTAAPAVAIVGAAKPTDYGVEMARGLARGLAAARVTVVSQFANGIPVAALAGALEADGPALAVMAGGVEQVAPAHRRGCYEQVLRCGCAIAELPCGHPARRWSALARARTVAGLARLTVVIEAGDAPSELAAARIAHALGRTVAAVPGRVTSPASVGANRLLREGAPLVRDARDVLDLLYGLGLGVGAGRSERSDAAAPVIDLEPRLHAVLQRVGAGRDTPGKLTNGGEDAGDTLLALAELEVMGLLGRGDGGRYVPRESCTASTHGRLED
jgi:DNA processing protein